MLSLKKGNYHVIDDLFIVSVDVIYPKKWVISVKQSRWCSIWFVSESKCIRELSSPHTTVGHRRAHWHSTKSPLSLKSLSGNYLGTLRENFWQKYITFLISFIWSVCLMYTDKYRYKWNKKQRLCNLYFKLIVATLKHKTFKL